MPFFWVPIDFFARIFKDFRNRAAANPLEVPFFSMRCLSRRGERLGFDMHRANLFMTDDGNTLLCEDSF